jgi:hypothetical protein
VRVIVYVEGPSDQKALQALLKPVIDAARSKGTGITFSPQGGKAAILDDVPRKAAEHLQQNEHDWVFALPDLYPMAAYNDGPNRHRSFAELRQLLHEGFRTRADKIDLSESARKHFRVHCLKHDLEGLLLAAPDVLRQRLKTTDALRDRWRLPVEDQNDDKPPKRIVEELFKKYRKKPGYVDTSDAVWIMERASLNGIESACPQRFAPFVREIRLLAEGQDPDAPATAAKGGERPRADDHGAAAPGKASEPSEELS